MQHEPTTPAGGAGPGLPLALLTHSLPSPQVALMVFCPQWFGRFVPHCPAFVYVDAVMGVQHAPAVDAGGGGLSPPVVVQTPPVHAHVRLFCPHPFGSELPHCPAYVAPQVFAAQHVLLESSQIPLGHDPHVTVEPHPSSNVPHSKAAKSAHVFAAHGVPQTPFELQT